MNVAIEKRLERGRLVQGVGGGKESRGMRMPEVV